MMKPLRENMVKNRMKTSINKDLVLLVLLIAICASLFTIGVQPVKASPATYWVQVGGVGDGTSEGTPAGNITWVITNQPGRAWNITTSDIIKVKPGTYDHTIETFPLTIDDVNVTIISTGGAANTIISAIGSSDSACVFNITANYATIGGSGVGFTIKGGAAGTGTPHNPPYAHVIDIYADYATIQFNTIVGYEGNTAGIHIAHSTGTGHLIKSNSFRHRAAGEGWGIFAESLTATLIEDNLWYGDSQTWGTVEGAPGTCLIIADANTVTIKDNTAYNIKYSWLTFVPQYPRLDSNNYMYEDCRDGTITNIAVTNNIIHDIQKSGSKAVNFKPGAKGGQPGGWTDHSALTIGTNVTIGSSNKFYDNSYGIVIDQDKNMPGGIGYIFNADNVKINNNEIYSNADYGVWNGQSETVDATLNWWGDVSGPSGVGVGTGDRVSTNVNYTPWLDSPGGSPISGTGKSESISGSGTLDARSEADITVTVTGSGDVEVSVMKYSRNPTGSSFSGDIGKYYDVHINTTTGVTSLTLRFFYTDADIAGKTESLLKMHWWDGGTWRLCNPQTIHMDPVGGYSGYIEVIVTATSTPMLSQLVGTPFGIGEEPKPVGGIVIDNDFEFFAPWIGIAALAITAIVTVAFTIKKRKR